MMNSPFKIKDKDGMPKIEAQIVLDIAYRLFTTIYFEFDFESMKHILNCKMFFVTDVKVRRTCLLCVTARYYYLGSLIPALPTNWIWKLCTPFLWGRNSRRF